MKETKMSTPTPLVISKDDEDKKSHNVIIMSEAGKPIFARHGSEEEINRQCGLLQAIRTVTQGNPALGLGEIQCLESDHSCIVFMSVGSITLVSISKTSSQGIVETEAFGRLQLEYLYAQLIFNLTDQVQTVFRHNPGYDLRSMMTSGDNLLHGLLDESGPDGNAGPFLVGGVQSVFPISHKLRKKTSQVLQSIGSKTENLAFALIVLGDKLVSLVQPSYRPHQLRVSDLHLILNFVNKQPGLLTSELWIPMCLPRFNSTGFLYAYTHCLDIESRLCLILISSHNTTEQFQLLRAASAKIRDELSFPSTTDSVLTITTNTTPPTVEDEDAATTSTSAAPRKDVEWTREESFDIDDDYVTISSDIVERRANTPGGVHTSLLQEIRDSAEFSSFEHIANRYLNGGSNDEDSSLILHFLFRVDVAVKPSSRNTSRSKGYLTQCISPHPIPFPFTTTAARRRLWTYYQKLSLRLRLGSATPESCHDAFDMISQDGTPNETEAAFPGIAKDCPAMGLLESPPNVHGVTYIAEETEIFLAMNGRDFELYMVASNVIPIKQAAALGTKLVRRLMADEKKLFLSSPLTWKE
jgi:hypothetical protein